MPKAAFRPIIAKALITTDKEKNLDCSQRKVTYYIQEAENYEYLLFVNNRGQKTEEPKGREKN